MKVLALGRPSTLNARALDVELGIGASEITVVTWGNLGEHAPFHAIYLGPSKAHRRLPRSVSVIGRRIAVLRFAIGCATSPRVRSAASSSHIVLALDSFSYLAAWLLGKQVPPNVPVLGGKPEVIRDLPAFKLRKSALNE